MQGFWQLIPFANRHDKHQCRKGSVVVVVVVAVIVVVVVVVGAAVFLFFAVLFSVVD